MKKISLYLFAVAALALTLTSCFKDDNNYNYSEINRLSAVENLERSYSVFQGEEVVIEPTVTFTVEGDHDITYSWVEDLNEDEPYSTSKTSTKLVYEGSVIGQHTLTLLITDNITGVTFVRNTTIDVKTVYKNGWLVLSDNGGRSVLSIVKMKSEKVDGTDVINYIGEEVDLIPDLGTGPIKLVEHWLSADADYNVMVGPIMVVQKDRTVEVNGESMLPEVYTDDEFEGVRPGGTWLTDAYLCLSSNYVLDSDGHLYSGLNALPSVPYTSGYTSLPLHNGARYSKIIPPAALENSPIILAIDADLNEIIGINVGGYASYDGTLNMTNAYDGKRVLLTGESEYDHTLFKDPGHKWERLYIASYSDMDYYEAPIISVLKNNSTGKYVMHKFLLDMTNYNREATSILTIDWEEEPWELESSVFDEFVDLAVCYHRNYCAVASANKLYMMDYYDAIPAKLAMTFDSPIKKIYAKDHDTYFSPSGPHIGVALANGDFVIVELNYDNPPASRELYRKGGFGDIVDVRFKWGSETASYYYQYIPF